MVDQNLEVNGEEGLALACCLDRALNQANNSCQNEEREENENREIGCSVGTLAALVEGVASVACFTRSTESSEVSWVA